MLLDGQTSTVGLLMYTEDEDSSATERRLQPEKIKRLPINN